MTFINKDIPLDLPPIDQWLWYVRASDFSIHLSPLPVEGATQVASPPEPDTYTWDWVNGGWIYNLDKQKVLAKEYVRSEFVRIQKFNYLSLDAQTQVLLTTYSTALKDYIKNFGQAALVPEVPQALTDDSFYLL